MTKASDPIPRSYKPWIVASLVVLIGSLFLFSATVVAAFVSFGDRTTPLYVIVLGVLSALGIALGFGGLFLLMATAGFQAWRESRRIQILPPDHSTNA